MIYKVKRFSKHRDEERIRSGAAMAEAGAAGYLSLKGLGEKGNKALGKHLDEFVSGSDQNLSRMSGNDQVYNNLLKEAKGKKINVIRGKQYGPLDGIHVPIKENRNEYAKDFRELRRKGQISPEQLKEEISVVNKIFPRKMKSTVIMSGRDTSAMLAHEMGHAAAQENEVTSKILRGGKKVSDLSKKHLSGKAGSLLGFGYGAAMKAREDVTGKKESKLSKALPTAVVAATQLPTLIEEADASRRGYRLMKKAGASKPLLKASRKAMARWHSSYALDAARPILAVGAAQIAGHYVAKGLGKMKNKEDKK